MSVPDIKLYTRLMPTNISRKRYFKSDILSKEEFDKVRKKLNWGVDNICIEKTPPFIANTDSASVFGCQDILTNIFGYLSFSDFLTSRITSKSCMVDLNDIVLKSVIDKRVKLFMNRGKQFTSTFQTTIQACVYGAYYYSIYEHFLVENSLSDDEE